MSRDRIQFKLRGGEELVAKFTIEDTDFERVREIFADRDIDSEDTSEAQ